MLHFSEALTHHVLRDRGMQAVLVLNKADLVPGVILAEWEAFFHTRWEGARRQGSGGRRAGGGRGPDGGARMFGV